MVLENKRKAEESALVAAPKKTRTEVATTRNKSVLQAAPARTSNLFAPIMALEGHEGEIFTVEFHPEGGYLASSGFDRRICKFCEPNLTFCFNVFLVFSCLERVWGM